MMNKKLFIQIQGMTCPSCEKIVTQALEELPGISEVVVNKDENRGTLEADLSLIDPSQIIQVIEEAGLSYEHTPSGIDTMNVIVELNSFIEHEQEILANLHRAVEPDSIELESDLALIAIVGRGMKDGRGVAAKVFTALANKKINVKMIDQGSSELNIIVGVKNIHFNDAIRAIYNTFIEQE